MPRLQNRVAARISACAIAASAAIAILMGPAQGQPLVIQTISAGQALKIVNAAIAKCSEPGPRITISVAVVDAAGNPRMLLNADTAAPHTTMVFLAVGIGLNVPLVIFYNWFAHHAFSGKLNRTPANGRHVSPAGSGQ